MDAEFPAKANRGIGNLGVHAQRRELIEDRSYEGGRQPL